MDFMSLVIVGAAVSVLVQIIKKTAGTSRTKTLVLAIVVSLIAAGIYVAFKDTTYWQVALQVLAYASLVYAVLWKQLES